MKIRTALAAAVCGTLLLGGCAKAPEPVEVHPPFWEVSDAETGGHVYLLGSMHVGIAGTEYPYEILAAFADSDIIACEVDTVALQNDKDEIQNAMSLLLCPEGQTAADIFGESYTEIRDFFKSKGIYNSAYDRYLPAMWNSLITSKMAEDCGYDSDYSTETLFLNMAKEQDKQIYEIESAAEQYSLNANEPLSLQVYTLEDIVNSDYEERLEELRGLYSAWSSFDSDALEALCNESDIPEEYAADYEAYYNAMYTERQRNMADYVINRLENGDSVFMLVGAMHYYAEPDILTLLEEAGYEVYEIRADQTSNAAA